MQTWQTLGTTHANAKSLPYVSSGSVCNGRDKDREREREKVNDKMYE
jgi:hypothetical protein